MLILMSISSSDYVRQGEKVQKTQAPPSIPTDNGGQWTMVNNRKWWTMDHDRQWTMVDHGQLWTMDNGRQWTMAD